MNLDDHLILNVIEASMKFVTSTGSTAVANNIFRRLRPEPLSLGGLPRDRRAQPCP